MPIIHSFCVDPSWGGRKGAHIFFIFTQIVSIMHTLRLNLRNLTLTADRCARNMSYKLERKMSLSKTPMFLESL